MRGPKPYFRKQKQAWYVQINGQRLSLGTDKKQAWQKYYEIMAGNRPIEESTATVAELFERYPLHRPLRFFLPRPIPFRRSQRLDL